MVGKAVQGNFDGNYARVISRFIQQVDKRFGAVEGEAEQHIVILQVVDGAACIPFGKVDRNKRLGFVIKPAFFLLVRVKSRRQSKAEGEIQRDGLNQKAGRGYFKLFAEEIDHPFAGHRGKLQADHIQPAALFEHFLHNAAEVDVKIVQSLVDRDIRIAGNTEETFFLNPRNDYRRKSYILNWFYSLESHHLLPGQQHSLSFHRKSQYYVSNNYYCLYPKTNSHPCKA